MIRLMRSLWRRDDYDLATNLDAPQRPFMLGTWMPDARQRVVRLRQLIDVSGTTSIRVDANAVAQPPNTRGFWERALRRRLTR